jgi:NAD(P)-dependent dehydrogenase (short-subunit alcohol dehydrogenase family)
MKFENSSFVVTGGASGLGEATARRFHGAGARVLSADLNVERGESLAAELGNRAAFQRTDVSAEMDAQACVDKALAAFGALQGHIIENDMLNGESIRLDGAVRLAPK